MEQQDEVKVAWGMGIAGHVAESGEPVNIPDAYQVGTRIACGESFSIFHVHLGTPHRVVGGQGVPCYNERRLHVCLSD